MVGQLTIFSDRQFRWVTYIAIALAAILLAVNTFLIGGDAFVFSFNSAINAPMAVVITIAAMTAWNKVGTGKYERLMWAGILLGWLLWTLAEVIYSLYSILGQEAPYPSSADIFWMIGYIPMGLGLYLRSRSMPVKPSRRQVLTIAAFSLVTILLASVFVFWPTFQSFDPGTPMENLINIAYPVEDCLLLIVVWRLFFTYEKGESGFGWRLLAIGFILLTIGDLVYLYANSTDPILYYPDMKANFISRFGSDVPYSLAYLSWLLGIFALRIPAKTKKIEAGVVEAPIELKKPQKYAHILIFTRYDNSIIDASLNYSTIFRGRQIIKGGSLANLLELSQEASHALEEKLILEKKITDLPVELPENPSGAALGWLCGIAIYDPQGDYSGANLVLTVPVDNGSYDDLLNLEKRSMASRLLAVTGSQCKEKIDQFLLGYYLPFFEGLFNTAQAQGGPNMSSAMLDELTRAAKANSWPVQFNQYTVLEAGDCPEEGLKKALPALLETAKQFVSNITDRETVEAQIKKINSRFSEEVQREIATYR